MRNKLRILVCPESGCPAIGRRHGDRCLTHQKPFEHVVYVRQDSIPKRPDFLESAAKVAEEFQRGMGKR